MSIRFTLCEMVQLPIAPSVWESRSRWLWTWIGTGVAALFAFALGIGLVATQIEALAPIGVAIFFLGFVVSITAWIGAANTFGSPTTYYMNEHYIWIKGAHANFLAPLPPWPYPPQ
jgi:hypothetical protein